VNKRLSLKQITNLLKEKIKQTDDIFDKLKISGNNFDIVENRLYYIFDKVSRFFIILGLNNFIIKIKNFFRIFPYYRVYTYDFFYKYNDKEFIDIIFEVFFNRKATQNEIDQYLNKLRSGEFSKWEIITEIYCLKESRYNNIKLLGIRKRCLLYLLYKIPYIKKVSSIIFLPKILIRLNRIENTFNIYQNNFINYQNILNNKLDKQIFEKYLKNIKESVDTNDFYIKKMDNFFENNQLSHKDLDNFYKYYSFFEDIFYPKEIVLKKQKIYLDYIKNYKNAYHLDIGCGRGELLYLLKNINIKAKGIDINPYEIEKLEKNNFDVKAIDAIQFLNQNKYKFTSISALQVIEHLNYKDLKELIKLSFFALEDNGILILETINSYNPVTINSLYMDETHKHLMPPELVSFMMQWYGFRDIEIIFTYPLPENLRVQNNPERNYHDYALIGYKK